MALLSTQCTVSVSGGERETIGIQTITAQLNTTYQSAQLTDGTGANKAQKQVTLSLGNITTGGTTLDLTAVGPAPFAAAVNFSKVKGIVIQNNDGNNTLNVGNAGSNIWPGLCSGNATISIDPGGIEARWIPVNGAVVDGAHKNLLLAAASGNITSATLIIVGEGS